LAQDSLHKVKRDGIESDTSHHPAAGMNRMQMSDLHDDRSIKTMPRQSENSFFKQSLTQMRLADQVLGKK